MRDLKRNKKHNVFKPKDAGKWHLLFIDDLNMVQADKFGIKPPHELLRHWFNYGGMYADELCNF
jgi:hypothetical protein